MEDFKEWTERNYGCEFPLITRSIAKDALRYRLRDWYWKDIGKELGIDPQRLKDYIRRSNVELTDREIREVIKEWGI